MAEWAETFKGAVLASEYDAETHMNSPLYVTRFDQATWFLLHDIGASPAAIKRLKLRVAMVRQSYQFLAELKGGELVAIRSGFIAVGAKHLRFLHRMFDFASGRLVASSDCTAVLASLATGRSVGLPAGFRKAAEGRLVTANLDPAAVDKAKGRGTSRGPRKARRRAS